MRQINSLFFLLIFVKQSVHCGSKMLCDEIISVVFDIGSLNVNWGYSGEDAPRFNCPSKFITNPSSIQGQMEVERKGESYYFGDVNLTKPREGFEVRDTIRNGVIEDYDAYKGLLNYCYDQLNQNKEQCKDYSLLLANNFATKTEREKVLKIIFEELGVTNFFTVRNAVLSAFSAGRSTALVFDIGAYQSTAIAVHEGYGLVKTQQVQPIGGETITQFYLQDLQNRYKISEKPLQYQLKLESDVCITGSKTPINTPHIHSSYHDYYLKELIRDIKKQTFSVTEAQTQINSQIQQYELPDGTNIDISAVTISEMSDCLFGGQSKLFKLPNLQKFEGIQSMINDAINASNPDIKTSLSNTILTTGGTTMAPGWHSSLNNRLQSKSGSICKYKLVTFPPNTNTQHSAFIGGSILGSLSSFQSMWVTKSEYEEEGYRILERKCPM